MEVFLPCTVQKVYQEFCMNIASTSLYFFLSKMSMNIASILPLFFLSYKMCMNIASIFLDFS
jgi:hypothetical protein